MENGNRVDEQLHQFALNGQFGQTNNFEIIGIHHIQLVFEYF